MTKRAKLCVLRAIACALKLSHCTEGPEYTLRIEWDSDEGLLKGFRNSPEFKAFVALVQPYAKDMEEMRHYAGGSVNDKSQSVFFAHLKNVTVEASTWKQLNLR